MHQLFINSGGGDRDARLEGGGEEAVQGGVPDVATPKSYLDCLREALKFLDTQVSLALTHVSW